MLPVATENRADILVKVDWSQWGLVFADKVFSMLKKGKHQHFQADVHACKNHIIIKLGELFIYTPLKFQDKLNGIKQYIFSPS